MKDTDIKDLTLDELKEKLGSEKEALRKMKFAHQVSAIENPMKIKETRRMVARINTLLAQKAEKKEVKK
ncbi:MAG TPA: 50S ribosomal protein L29 [Cyclobacteriaceae bacterium]|nr:50S ribosomal protein L29 [Cyclobacteriaceae bacterium]